MTKLVIRNLSVTIQGKSILRNLSLAIREGEIHAIMGPNGSGKSTLAKVLMGYPMYSITKGSISLNNKSLMHLSPDKRAQKGLFLAYQSPQKIPGLSLLSFLRSAYNTIHHHTISVFDFRKKLQEAAKHLHLPPYLYERSLNDNLSGGEMKKTEVLQMTILEPSITILDEIDSGLDIDALKTVCRNIMNLKKKTNMGIILITHYNRILKYIHPDYVHIITDGTIIKSGSKKLADEVERKGYCNICREQKGKRHSLLPLTCK